MHRTQIYLKEHEYAVLKQEAFNKNCSISEIVRNVIDNAFIDKAKHNASCLTQIVGFFKDDKTDVSVKHDKYLSENK
jgi:hypothetical protein